MKKTLSLALALTMALSLAACGNSGGSSSAPADASGSSSQANSSTSSSSANTESDLAYVQDKGTLVVGITEFEPMDYRIPTANGSALTPTWPRRSPRVWA